MFHLLIAQCDMNSSSIGSWQVLPYTIPIGGLYGSLLFYPFPMAFSVLCRMLLICLLDVPALGTGLGWYGVATRWFTHKSLRHFLLQFGITWAMTLKVRRDQTTLPVPSSSHP